MDTKVAANAKTIETESMDDRFTGKTGDYTFMRFSNNEKLSCVMVVWLAFFSTPFIFILGLILGVIIDKYFVLEPILSGLTAIGSLFAGIGALGTFYIAYKAKDIWKKKIKAEPQHNAFIMLRNDLIMWLASFEDVLDRKKHLPSNKIPIPHGEKDFYDDLIKRTDNEYNYWKKTAKSSRLLLIHGFKEHEDLMHIIDKNRVFFIERLNRYIRYVDKKNKMEVGFIEDKKMAEELDHLFEINSKTNEFKWIEEKILPSYNKMNNLKSDLENI